MIEPYWSICKILWFGTGLWCMLYFKRNMCGSIKLGHVLMGAYLIFCGPLALIGVQSDKSCKHEPFILDWICMGLEKVCSITIWKGKE